MNCIQKAGVCVGVGLRNEIVKRGFALWRQHFDIQLKLGPTVPEPYEMHSG